MLMLQSTACGCSQVDGCLLTRGRQGTTCSSVPPLLCADGVFMEVHVCKHHRIQNETKDGVTASHCVSSCSNLPLIWLPRASNYSQRVCVLTSGWVINPSECLQSPERSDPHRDREKRDGHAGESTDPCLLRGMTYDRWYTRQTIAQWSSSSMLTTDNYSQTPRVRQITQGIWKDTTSLLFLIAYCTNTSHIYHKHITYIS